MQRSFHTVKPSELNAEVTLEPLCSSPNPAFIWTCQSATSVCQEALPCKVAGLSSWISDPPGIRFLWTNLLGTIQVFERENMALMTKIGRWHALWMPYSFWEDKSNVETHHEEQRASESSSSAVPLVQHCKTGYIIANHSVSSSKKGKTHKEMATPPRGTCFSWPLEQDWTLSGINA